LPGRVHEQSAAVISKKWNIIWDFRYEMIENEPDPNILLGPVTQQPIFESI
jgi:hypothetical protein